MINIGGCIMKKVDVSETLKGSFDIYRKHFVRLLIFTSVFTAFSIFVPFYNFFANIKEVQWVIIPFIFYVKSCFRNSNLFGGCCK